MPRSYSFDHFTAQPPELSRAIPGQEKAQLTQEAAELGEGGDQKFHYGERFRKTKELFQVRAMNAQLEQLAREDAATTAELPEPPPRLASTPIGAVPPPQAAFEDGSWGDLWETSRATVALAQSALRDLGRVAGLLLRLPWGAARLGARKLVSLRG